MKNYLLLLVFIIGVYTSQAQNLPTETQPLIWLRADILGDSLNQWFDYSGNGYNTLLDTNQSFPTNTLYNYHPALYFSQNNKAFEVDYLPGAKEYLKAFLVYKANDSLNEYGLWSIKLDSSIEVGLSSYQILNVQKDLEYDSITSIVPTINSLVKSWRRVKVDSSVCRLYIGGNDSIDFEGKIAEFVLFNKRITSSDSKKVHGYLAIKYGITLKDLDYVNSNDDIIFEYKTNKTYFNDVACIARDDSMQLYQKQSAGNGGQAELILSAGILAPTNDSNQAQLNNLDFIIWGHNGASLVVDNDTSNASTYSNKLQREWLITLNGTTSSQISTNLIMDASAYDTTQNMVLLVNPDANSFFDPNICYQFYPDSVDTSHHYYFSNINWDADSSGSDKFTFMIPTPIQSTQRRGKNSSSNNEGDDTPITDSTVTEFQCNVYPNPSIGYHNIEIHARENTDFMIRYYNAEGRLVDSKTCIGKKDYILKHFLSQSGVYLINIESSNLTKTLKLIVK